VSRGAGPLTAEVGPGTPVPARDGSTGDASGKVTNRLRIAEISAWRTLILFATIIVVWVVFNQLTDGTFLTSRNLSNLSVEASVTALVALGVAALIVTRELDLSVGSALAVVVVLTTYGQVVHGWSTGVAIVAGLAVGLLVGTINGTMTAFVRVPSFIVTLAAFSYLRGVAYSITNGQTYSGTRDGFIQIANGFLAMAPILIVTGAVGLLWFARLAQRRRSRGPQALGDDAPALPRRSRLLRSAVAVAVVLATAVAIWTYLDFRGLPVPVAIWIAVAVLMGFGAKHTAFGRHCFAIGGNPEAARRAGINIERIVIVLFIISGVLAAISGLIQASLLDSGPPTAGLLLPLDAITAAVVGGTSLFGGQGSVVGVVLGTVLLASILNGLSIMAVNSFVVYMVSGVVLLIAVCADALAQRYLHRG
jgi:D-xylose transport system permease protein